MGSSGALYPRGALTNLFTNTTCPTPRHLTEVEDPFLGNMTFYHFNMIVSGACTLLTCLIIFHLKWQHALHFSVPTEQVKIMRIINMLPAFSVLSFISICWPNSYVYMEGWTEVFQAIALYAFHMLLIDFLGPTERLRDEFFGNLKVKKAFKRKQYREGLSWLKLSYYSTLQYPFVVTVCAIGQSIAQSFNVYCLDSNRPIFAHLWLEILQEVSVTIAINAIIRFYYNTKDYMKEHKPLMKLLSFKLIVGVIFLEKIVFLILESSSIYKETNKLSYADVHMGIPTMVICIQMVPFAIFMHFAFGIQPYRVAKDQDIEMIPEADDKGRPIPRSYQGGRFGLHAWAAYLNPLEFWREMRSMARTLSVHKVRHQKPIYQADIDAEKESKKSAELAQNSTLGTEQIVPPERAASTDSAGSSGHQMPYANSHYQQSQPFIPQAEFPLGPAQPALPDAQTDSQGAHYMQHSYSQVSTYGQPDVQVSTYGQPEVSPHGQPHYDHDGRYDGRS